jgi:hypothetical protein
MASTSGPRAAADVDRGRAHSPAGKVDSHRPPRSILHAIGDARGIAGPLSDDSEHGAAGGELMNWLATPGNLGSIDGQPLSSANCLLSGMRISRFTVFVIDSIAPRISGRHSSKVAVEGHQRQQTPIRAEIQLDGATSVGTIGHHLAVSSDELYRENDLDHPHRVVPRELPRPACDRRFSVTLPPYSVNVLRIPASGK